MLFLKILMLICGIEFSPINSEQPQSIKFEYIGEITKPIPSILFYNSQSIDSILLSKEENSIRLTNNEFDVIKEIVSRKVGPDSSIPIGFYQFTIVSKGKTEILLTAKKYVVRQVFVEIIDSLPKDERKEKTLDFWNSLSSRL